MSATGWGAIILIWALLTETRLIDPLFLASPTDTFTALLDGLCSGELVWGALATVQRDLSGFTIAVILGIPLGLLFGGIPKVHQAIGSVVDGLRSMPATALFPAFLLAFGIGDKAKIAVVTFVCLWAMAIYTAYGVRTAGDTRRFLLTLHGVSFVQRFFDCLFYPALPSIIGGMRTTLSFALVITIGIEMIIGTKKGLGQSIYEAQATYRIPSMYAAIILAAIAGIVLNMIFLKLASRLVHWDNVAR